MTPANYFDDEDLEFDRVVMVARTGGLLRGARRCFSVSVLGLGRVRMRLALRPTSALPRQQYPGRMPCAHPDIFKSPVARKSLAHSRPLLFARNDKEYLGHEDGLVLAYPGRCRLLPLGRDLQREHVCPGTILTLAGFATPRLAVCWDLVQPRSGNALKEGIL